MLIRRIPTRKFLSTMALASSEEITGKILKLDEVEENVYRFESEKFFSEKSSKRSDRLCL